MAQFKLLGTIRACIIHFLVREIKLGRIFSSMHCYRQKVSIASDLLLEKISAYWHILKIV